MFKKWMLGLFLLAPATLTMANGIVGALVVTVTEIQSYGSQKVYFVTTSSRDLLDVAQKITRENNIIRIVIDSKNYYAFATFDSKEGDIEGRFFGSNTLVKIEANDEAPKIKTIY